MIRAILESWCEQQGLPPPQCEYRFHATRKWRFDAAWPECKVALEIDGGLYVQGRHSRGKGREKDLEKLNTALTMGWRVIVVSTGQVKEGKVFDWLQAMLKGAAA